MKCWTKTDILFFLLRKGLGMGDTGVSEHESDTPVFTISDREWMDLWAMALKQAVCGIVYDGMGKLPKEMQPPRRLMLQFMAYTEGIRKANMRMRSAAEEIVGWFEEEGLEPMVIKGLTVGALYPNPELRMPGDIDLFFHRDYDRVVPIVRKKGIEVTLDSNHDKFSYKGIPIELHHTAFKTLFPIEKPDFSPVLFESEGYSGRILNLKANAMLLLMHPARHFMNEGIGLRHVCDWAMFLKRYEDRPELEEAWNEVKRQGAGRFAIEFTAIAVHYMGLELKNPEKWTGESKPELRDRMLELIIKRGNFAKDSKSYRTARYFKYLYNLLKYVFAVYPYWKQFFFKNVPRRIVYRLLLILKGKPFATE